MGFDKENINSQKQSIQSLKNKVISMNIDHSKKEELLNRLDRLEPSEEHTAYCGCDNCSARFDEYSDQPKYIQDPVIAQVFQNISNPFIPKIMNNKFVPFIVIGVGIAICVIGFKMYKKTKVANPAV